MKTTIKTELAQHILDTIEYNGIDSFESSQDLHHLAFNQDYYIIGYYNADQWVERHNLTAWDVIGEVHDYEMDMFGEVTTDINSESMVNMYVYIQGEQLLNELDTQDNNQDEWVSLLTDLIDELER